MDIRTKLVFALVAVSLGSMAALGIVTYGTARDEFEESTREHLEALAESRKMALATVLEGWRESVNLIASRTQLRESLARYNEEHGAADRARVEQILSDAMESVDIVLELTVRDAHGHVLASTTATPYGGTEVRMQARAMTGDGARFERVAKDATDRLTVHFAAPLRLEDRLLGSLLAVLRPTRMVDLTANYNGLGETGETVVVARVAGEPRILHPVRDPPSGPSDPLQAPGGDPAAQALAGVEAIFTDNVVDYRDQPVWAATRYLEEPDWGVVVKFDTAELKSPVFGLRDRMWDLTLALSAFAILLGVLLGLWFSKPIHDLAEVADRIRHGDFDARAEIRSQDEVGMLAGVFNRMADALIETNRELRVKLADTDPGFAMREAGRGAKRAARSGASKDKESAEAGSSDENPDSVEPAPSAETADVTDSPDVETPSA